MRRVVRPVNIILLLIVYISAFRFTAQGLAVADPSHLKAYFQDTPGEDIFLHLDRDKFVAGEDIWFSIYTIDRETERLSAMSLIAYVELLNPWDVAVIQTRFQLTGGRGEGNLTLPDSISSGSYTIRAYTNWMKNLLPDNCYSHDIDIFNPFGKLDFRRKEGLMNKTDLNGSAVNYENRSTVTLTSDSIFGKREKVTLKFGTVKNYEGSSVIFDMSISVTPSMVAVGSQGIEKYLLSKKRSQKDTLSVITDPPLHTFESDGHHLSFVLKYRGDIISDSSRYLYMSIQGKVAEFRYAERDASGRFTFVLPVDDVSRMLILQPEYTDNNMILEIEPSFPRLLPEYYTFNDTLSDSQIDLFSLLSFNYQAAKIYGLKLKKEAEVNDGSRLKKRRFYGIPEMEVSLDDFISLPSMQEVFFELLPGIVIRPRRSGYIMQITNPLTGAYYNEPPLVMIDGVIINDLAILMDLDPEVVEKIEVVKTPYLIGDLVLHGIVNVITRTGNFSDVAIPDYTAILPYRVVDKPATILVPDYSDEQTRLSRIPDLRNTLYWNPSVNTDTNGKAEIQFWTSDFPGQYIININGISDSGEMLSIRKSFMVK